MEQNLETNSFKKLLNRLQEDSWQMELLISAFAIFGLFYALDPIAHKLQIADIDKNQAFVIFFTVVYFSLQILIFNLLLHVLLRGLWIGSLGLRYVFGEIDFDKLNYSEQFTNHLKKKVGSFDDYIEKLENFSSIIFAISFLLVFYTFAFFILIALLIAFNNPVPDWMVYIIRPLFVVFAIGVILTFIDFITQGLLKKNKWVAKFYYPFYRVFSILTLSFLYKPLIYNLLDNKQGRRIAFGLIPFYLIIYILFNLYYQKSNFITADATRRSNNMVANGRNYEDIMLKNDDLYIGDFVIQSKVITEPYLKIIVPLNKTIEDALIDFNPLLKPEKDNRGLHFESPISFIAKVEKANFIDEAYLTTFEKKYSFKIDSITYKTDFVVSNVKHELSFETYIGIQGLSEGKHTVEFQSLKHQDTDSLVSIRTVPFWYYKD